MNRREAAPLEFELLSDSQKQAVENIARSLQSALEDLDAVSESSHKGDDELEDWRSSRNFFVSGEPGSGKTSVYLTLKRLLRKNSMKVEGRQFQGLRTLQDSQSRLQWLETLDLEPAGKSTNFLAAVLVRIEGAMDSSKLAESLRDRRPGLLENRDALQDLRRLENDVVLAWDGTVPERAEHVDPEVFSQDVLRAEKARLQVNQRLRKTLGPLDRAENDQPTLYVLAVDDFYLHPASSLELLRLLRMISVPQLFILVLGDLEVVRQLFELDQLGRLVRLVGEKSVQPLLFSQEQLTARAGALTSQALDKLVPHSQQAVLEVMDNLKALEHRPQRPGTAEKQKEESLADLLREARLVLHDSNHSDAADERLGPKNLYEFLILRELSGEIASASYTYSGLSVLDLPPREIANLWLSLDGLVGRKRREKNEQNEKNDGDLWDGILREIVKHTIKAIERQTYVGKEGKERCLEAIQGTKYDKRIFQPKALSVEDRLGRERSFKLKNSWIMTVSPHSTWRIRPNMGGRNADISSQKGGLEEGSINYLAPRPTAWLTVLHDLMALSDDRLEGDSLTPPAFKLTWVIVSAESGSERGWLTPNWPTFRQFDLLAFRWNSILERTEMRNPDVERLRTWLAYSWIDAITEILSGKWNPDREIQGLEIDDDEWQTLSEKTASLVAFVSETGWTSGHRDVVRGWLLRLEIFLREEFAIPGPVRDQLLSEPLEELWEREQEEIESICRREGLEPPGKIRSGGPATA